MLNSMKIQITTEYFGLETGFMYLMFETKEQANEKANELNKSYNLEV